MPARGGDDGDNSSMSMRGHVQQKFLNDMIDSTGDIDYHVKTNSLHSVLNYS